MLASRGVVGVLSLGYLALATRSLGITDFGRFALITGAAQALTTLVAFQTWQILVQFGTRHVQEGNDRALAALLRACAVLDAGSALLGVGAAAVILVIFHDDLGINETLLNATLIYAAAQLLSIRSTPIGMLRMRDRFSLAAAIDSVTPVVRLIGAGLVAWLHPTVQAFLAVWGTGEVVTAIAYWAVLARTGDLKRLAERGDGVRQLIADNPGIVRFSINSNLISTLGLSSKQFPLLLAGATVGAASAGAFRLATQLAQALTKLSQLGARAAFPEIVREIGSKGIRQAGQAFRRSLVVSSLVGLIVFVTIALLGRPVLSLMGDGFESAYPILLWLGAAGCIDLVTVGFEPVLMAAHRAGIALAARLVATAALFLIALTFAPMIGVDAIAIAVLANSLIVALVLGLVIARLTRPA